MPLAQKILDVCGAVLIPGGGSVAARHNMAQQVTMHQVGVHIAREKDGLVLQSGQTAFWQLIAVVDDAVRIGAQAFSQVQVGPGQPWDASIHEQHLHLVLDACKFQRVGDDLQALHLGEGLQIGRDLREGTEYADVGSTWQVAQSAPTVVIQRSDQDTSVPTLRGVGLQGASFDHALNGAHRQAQPLCGLGGADVSRELFLVFHKGCFVDGATGWGLQCEAFDHARRSSFEAIGGETGRYGWKNQ